MMAKGQEQLQSEADTARRKVVDAKNRSATAKTEADAKKLFGTPLTVEEQGFIARIAPMMNKGRHTEKPSPADITRYAKLLKQKDSKKVVDEALGNDSKTEGGGE